jgi:hypothetical protein
MAGPIFNKLDNRGTLLKLTNIFQFWSESDTNKNMKLYEARESPRGKFLPFSRLGGVMVSVLATGPNGRGFKSGQGDGFLRAIKIRSTSSFGWEVKPEVKCRKILRHVKDPLTYQRY